MHDVYSPQWELPPKYEPIRGFCAPASDVYAEYPRQSEVLDLASVVLWTFEMALRDQCNFWDPLPWWDETLDAGNFHNSDMFTNTAYFGHLPGPDANVRCPFPVSPTLNF